MPTLERAKPKSSALVKREAGESLNERLYNEAVMRSVNLLSYREGLVQRVKNLFRKHDEQWLDRLGAVLVRMSDRDIARLGTGLSLAHQTDRTRAFADFLRDFRESSRDTSKVLLKELKQLAFDEAEWWRLRINHHVPDGIAPDMAVTKKSATNIAWKEALVLGDSMPLTIDRWGKYRAELLQRVVRKQIHEGIETRVVMKGLGGKQGWFARSVDGRPESLGNKVRDTVSGSASAGQRVLIDAPTSPIEDLRWISVLDTRTSKICWSRSGKLVNAELGGQLPPAHPRCRSSTFPILLEKQGFRPESAKDWMKRQPKEVQLEILGPNRLEMYETGEYDWPMDFIKDEKLITLDKLNRKGKTAR